MGSLQSLARKKESIFCLHGDINGKFFRIPLRSTELYYIGRMEFEGGGVGGAKRL